MMEKMGVTEELAELRVLVARQAKQLAALHDLLAYQAEQLALKKAENGALREQIASLKERLARNRSAPLLDSTGGCCK